MPTISGTEKRKTFSCPACGGFLWTEGLCGPCSGEVTDKDSPSVVEDVVYAYDEKSGKVRKRARKRG